MAMAADNTLFIKTADEGVTISQQHVITYIKYTWYGILVLLYSTSNHFGGPRHTGATVLSGDCRPGDSLDVSRVHSVQPTYRFAARAFFHQTLGGRSIAKCN
jgi:hypothetical protein